MAAPTLPPRRWASCRPRISRAARAVNRVEAHVGDHLAAARMAHGLQQLPRPTAPRCPSGRALVAEEGQEVGAEGGRRRWSGGGRPAPRRPAPSPSAAGPPRPSGYVVDRAQHVRTRLVTPTAWPVDQRWESVRSGSRFDRDGDHRVIRCPARRPALPGHDVGVSSMWVRTTTSPAASDERPQAWPRDWWPLSGLRVI